MGEVPPRAATGTDWLLRNSRRTRRFHTALYVTTGFLLLSGLSLLGEGQQRLEALLGGHVAAAHWHRWIGFALIGAAFLVLAARPGACRRFLAESLRFSRGELRWFATYPRFLLRPRRHSPARHEGHFDPGQRVMNCTVLVSFVALSITGIVMSFPQAVTPAFFAWGLRLHKLFTWVLVVAVAGHILVASGRLRAYRGVWRAMHGDGRVRSGLARQLWPRWVEQQEAADRETE